MLARDVNPNRLERVKLSINNLLDRVAGDRLGLIAFSGSAFLQCPLTLDHQAFAKTLNDLKVGIIKRPAPICLARLRRLFIPFRKMILIDFLFYFPMEKTSRKRIKTS